MRPFSPTLKSLRPLSFLVILIAICPLAANGQALKSGSIEGVLLDDQGKSISMGRVILKELNRTTFTSDDGKYVIDDVPSGEYTLLAFAYDYQKVEQPVAVSSGKKEINFRLEPLAEKSLEEVTVSGMSASTFGIRSLNTVEGMALYEGKKTEVVELQQLTANKSTNNARQVFAKMAGANIWESDGAGLQLGIGARGLSPNRTSNFNTRQNGSDMSADAIGYPESYYMPPLEAVDRIEIVRGAASLQYGTQFGGMLNFIMKKGPTDKKFEFTTRQTVGSYGFWNAFNSIGGQTDNVNYYGFYQRKQGDGWRENSDFELDMVYGSAEIELNEQLSVSVNYTHMNYLTQQPGGLTYQQFLEDPQRSYRDRNWFRVNWNLPTVTFNYKISPRTSLEFRNFALFSSREALGNLARINIQDSGEMPRTLIYGSYQNLGNETRLIHRYSIGTKKSVLLLGGRVYRGLTEQRQGNADKTDRPNFSILAEEGAEDLNYRFPNWNTAVFVENVFDLTDKLSVTPGFRWEYINTNSEGYYVAKTRDFAGNTVSINEIEDNQERTRSFLLAGLGVSYKWADWLESYGNFSQNYRAVTFNDLRIVNRNFQIDPNIQDERGYNADIGLRGSQDFFYFDASLFYLRYDDRIGETIRIDETLFREIRYRTNIGDSETYGLEMVGEVDFMKAFMGDAADFSLSLFTSFTLNHGRYLEGAEEELNVSGHRAGNHIELVPSYILRTGLTFIKNKLRATLQYSNIDEQFTDATNSPDLETEGAIIGAIPTYYVVDFSAQYQWEKLALEGSINNLFDNAYFTRRAEGYPGPGIIPADGRTFFLTVGWKISR